MQQSKNLSWKSQFVLNHPSPNTGIPLTKHPISCQFIYWTLDKILIVFKHVELRLFGPVNMPKLYLMIFKMAT
jgi:hypothetical protein